MTRNVVPLCSLLLLAALLAPARAQAPADRTPEAKRFVERLAANDLAGAVGMFDETMKSLLPEPKLREAWNGVLAQAGKLQAQQSTRLEKIGRYDVVYVTCRFEKAPLDVKVVFDGEGKVAGLFFQRSQPAVAWQPPAYCRAGGFKEREVTVGSGEWALPGTLSVPAGAGPFPVVVLVHGSGPQDRDETIGPNKPFADLACGLASQGVAVLRYEKRTKEHAPQFIAVKKSFTVQDETVDDALEAAKLLRSAPGVDPKRVFVLGHSLGGMLVPRIGRQAADLAGLIVLAGTTRPLEDVIVEQLAYIGSIGGSTSEADKKAIQEIEAQVAKVKALDASKAGSTELLMGAPASYWLDLRGYKPAEAARALKQRMLILQGERDYQVTMADFQNWKEALGGRKDVTFKTYPDLNHLFMTGKGKAVPAEYEAAGHVARQVVEDMAAWVKR